MAKQEKGVTGLSVFNGIITEEFLRELRGAQGYKKYNEMRLNSPVIGAMLYYHEMAVRKVSWNFVNHESKEPDERIDFLNYARDNMTQSWNEFISEVLSFLWAGYSLFYVNRKRDDRNQLIWDTFSPRSQNTVSEWILNYPNAAQYDAKKRNGDVLGFVQVAPPSYQSVTILADEMLHFRTRTEKNNPEGVSLLRNAYTSYYFAKNLQAAEAIGFERDLNGLPVIKMPSSASTDEDNPNSDASKAATTVRNLRNDEQGGVVLPFEWELQLLSSTGRGFAAIGATIQRYESRMLMSTLSQFIMLGQDGTGSFALSQDSTSIAEMVVNATADIIAETFTKQEIPRILKLNGYDPTGICMEHSPAGDTDISVYADFLQKIGDKVTWDAKDELWLRQMAGMPEKSEDELVAAQEEAKAAAEEARQQFLQRAQGIQGAQAKAEDDEYMQPKKPIPQRNSVTTFSGTPADERKRLQMERQMKDIITATLEKQRRKVLKAAKEMRNA